MAGRRKEKPRTIVFHRTMRASRNGVPWRHARIVPRLIPTPFLALRPEDEADNTRA